MSARLYVIPTPIGHLADITLRALEQIKKLDLLLCEDTRHTRRLLMHYSIAVPTESFHIHNESRKVPRMMARMRAGGLQVGLVCDAGTPSVSDPGFSLVRACWKHSIEVECLPGATACIPALVASGFPCDRFVFEGFLPRKRGRKSRLTELKEETRTFILYESPHRVVQTIGELIEVFGAHRPAALFAEMTKQHARSVRGTLKDLQSALTQQAPKGEYTLVIAAQP